MNPVYKVEGYIMITNSNFLKILVGCLIFLLDPGIGIALDGNSENDNTSFLTGLHSEEEIQEPLDESVAHEYTECQPLRAWDEILCVTVSDTYLRCCCNNNFYISHSEGCWLGVDKGYTTVGYFGVVPCWVNSCFTPLTNLELHVFNCGDVAANVGLGVRYLASCHCDVVGLFTFYDYLRGCGSDYHQIGIGFEWFRECYDIRLNGYLPIGPSVRYGKIHEYNEFIGEFHATCRQRQAIMKGVDLEIGKWLCRRGPCSCFDLYGAIGTYYYTQTKCDSHSFVGAQARVRTEVAEGSYLELKGGYDKYNRWMVQGEVSLSLVELLCCCGNLGRFIAECWGYDQGKRECYWTNENLCRLPYRQRIITLDCPQCCYTWNWDSPPR